MSLVLNKEMLVRLQMDAGTRTIGELIQERQWAVCEIQKLSAQLDSLAKLALASKSNFKNSEKFENLNKDQPEFMRMNQVCKRLEISRSTLYRWIQLDEFPKPQKIGTRLVRWKTEEIDEWLDKTKTRIE